MKTNQNRFWRALERLFSGAVAWEWQRELGPEIDIARPFLRLEPGQAETYPCTNVAGCGCPHRVEPHGHGRWLALCDPDEGCAPIMVESDELRLFAADTPKLCRSVAQAIGLTVPTVRRKITARAELVGTWGAAHSEVYLMFPADNARMVREVERLFWTQSDPFILLTPTGVHSSPEVESALKRQSCIHLPLDRALVLSGSGRGGFTVTNSIAVSLDQFAQGLVRGNGLVKTVERLGRDIGAVAKGTYELHQENEELRRLHADGVLKFATRVQGEDFQAFAVIMALGNRKAAADFLKLPHRTFYDRVDRWKDGSRDYQRMFRLVEWRKAQGRKLKVRLEDSIAFGDSGGVAENPHTVEEVLTEMREGTMDSRDYPELLRDIFDLLAKQNSQNWQSVRKEALEILSDEVPQ